MIWEPMGVKLAGEDGLVELWDVTPEGETMASPHDRGPLTQVGVDGNRNEFTLSATI